MTEQYTKTEDHVEIAKGRQVWQYKDQPNFDALITAHVERIQLLENTFFDLLAKRDLTNAIGVQLDLLGADYQVTRIVSEGDEDYRVRIRTTISFLSSFGQVSSLNFNLSRLVQPRIISLRQIFPLKILMWIFVDDFSDIQPDEAERIDIEMQQVKAAGVGLSIGLQLNTSNFIPAPTIAGGPAGQGVATVLAGTDGGAFVKSLI